MGGFLNGTQDLAPETVRWGFLNIIDLMSYRKLNVKVTEMIAADGASNTPEAASITPSPSVLPPARSDQQTW